MALLCLRVGAGVSMIVNHAWAMIYTGWEHYWLGKDWILADAASALSLPFPVAWATVLAGVLLIGSIFLVAGLLGRLTSAALLLAVIGVLYALATHPLPGDADLARYRIEVCILYVLVYIVHLLMGPGALALDRVFSRYRRPRRHHSLEDVE